MEINDLALGKWHKAEIGAVVVYMKPSLLLSNSLKGEVIHTVNAPKYREKVEVTNSSYWTKAEILKDLSEIQQYLPQGHVDKKKSEIELIDGNWYEVILDINDSWLYKFRKGDRKTTNYKSVRVCNSSKYPNGTVCEDNQIMSTKLANLEDVYKYFPEERPKVEEKSIKLTSMELGKYYQITWAANGITYIVKNIEKQPSLDLGSNSFSDSGYFNSPHQWQEIKEASPEDIKWLESCLKANKFIPKEEALKSMEKQELTSLPEKWCIRVDESNKVILQKWLIDNYLRYPQYTSSWTLKNSQGYYFHSYPVPCGGHSDTGINSGFTEITFEQFKKWVLKENIPIEKWIPKAGDWVYVTSNNGSGYKKEGDIFQIPDIKGNEDMRSWVYFELGSTISTNRLRLCKPEEIPNTKPMEAVNEDWCVKVTPENKQDIIKWGKETKGKGTDGTAQYYGEVNRGYNFSNKSWGKVLTTEEFYAKIGKTVPKKEEKNLVGRYLKAVIDYPCAGAVKKGEYGKIVKNNLIGWFVVDFPSQSDYGVTPDRLEDSSRFELMPEGFIPPDKQEKPKEMETFNVGDWVIITLSSRNWNQKMNTFDSKCVQITSKPTSDRIRFKDDDGWTWSHSDRHFRKAFPHEIPSIEQPKDTYMFKIGDKVRCIGESCIDGGWRKGLQFTITEITEGTKGKVAWKGDCGGGVYFHNLELVITNSSIPEYVECIKEGYFCELDQVGKVYKTSDPFPKLKACEGLKWDKVWLDNKDKYFKPSTYSAYMEQQSKGSVFPEKELLLQKAKLDYPPGTKIELYNGDIVTISEKPLYWGEYNNNIIWNGDGYGRIYYNGKWAKIISKPQESLLEEAKRRYPDGTKFRCPVDHKVYTVEKDVKNTLTIYYDHKDKIDGGLEKGFIYCEGKWAEIVDGFGSGEIKSSINQYPYKQEECYEKRPLITIDTDVTNIKVKKSASVTLKNTEKEVVVSVKRSKPILIN